MTVPLLLRLRLSLSSALILLGLFALAFVFQQDETRTIRVLTGMDWLYMVGAAGLLVWNRQGLL